MRRHHRCARCASLDCSVSGYLLPFVLSQLEALNVICHYMDLFIFGAFLGGTEVGLFPAECFSQLINTLQ